MSNDTTGTVGSGSEGAPGVDGDAAAWAALEAELGDEAGAGSDGDGAGGAEDDGGKSAEGVTGDGDGAKSEDTDAAKSEDGGKPTDAQLVQQYQAAMREERQRRQDLERQVKEINDAIAEAKKARDKPADQPPSLDDDPVAYFEHQQRELAKDLEETRNAVSQEQEAREKAQAHVQFMQHWAAQEASFASQSPDYWDAASHLRDTRMSQLEMIYPSTPQGDALAQNQGFASAEAMRQAHLEQEAAMYANQAMQVGRNPAEVFYQLAKSAGWSGAKPAAQQVTPQKKVEMARAGAQRAESLSGGGGSGGNSGNATAAELAELYITDPEAADVLFDKLAASGALG